MHELFRGLKLGHFACIAIDPPWHDRTWSDKGRGRSPKYQTMSFEQLEALPVGDYATDHAFLHLWIPGPFLAIGSHLPLMQAWGFTESAISHVWIKPTLASYRQGHLFGFMDNPKAFKMGMGRTTRQNAEFVVLGRRGDPRRLSRGVRQEIIEPAREHSRKPEQFYQRVEEFCAGPRLDIFGRIRRSGWTVIGNEADKFGRVKHDKTGNGRREKSSGKGETRHGNSADRAAAADITTPPGDGPDLYGN